MENGKKKSILIVDDVEDMCTSLQDVFVDLGYKTDIATNKTDAVKSLEKYPYDILLIDMLLEKQEGGMTVIKYVKEKVFKTSVFVMTAHQQEELLREALASGVLKVFIKPFDVGELVRTIEKEIERRRGIPN